MRTNVLTFYLEEGSFEGWYLGDGSKQKVWDYSESSLVWPLLAFSYAPYTLDILFFSKNTSSFHVST